MGVEKKAYTERYTRAYTDWKVNHGLHEKGVRKPTLPKGVRKPTLLKGVRKPTLHKGVRKPTLILSNFAKGVRKPTYFCLMDKHTWTILTWKSLKGILWPTLNLAS